MEQEPRKASDILLSLETKIDTLLGVIRTQDTKISILSNKLNAVMDLIKKQPQEIMKYSAEVSDLDVAFPSYETSPEKHVPISSEFTLPQEDKPNGFRRTSRPESYAGDNATLPKPPKQNIKQAPKPPVAEAEVVVPFNKKAVPVEVPQQPKLQEQANKNAVPVMQRVVDRNGKSVFLADVEVIDLNTNQQVFKTRTNGTGKWMASLAPSHYKIIIRKVESLTKERVETPQDVVVTGAESPLDLPMLIIK